MEDASQTHEIKICDTTTNTRGVKSQDNKPQGQQKLARRKIADTKLSRTKMRPRKLQREKGRRESVGQKSSHKRFLLSKLVRKRNVEAVPTRKTKRFRAKSVHRENKKRRGQEKRFKTGLLIRLPAEIYLPVELLNGGYCQKIR